MIKVKDVTRLKAFGYHEVEFASKALYFAKAFKVELPAA